jgi:putative transposase
MPKPSAKRNRKIDETQLHQAFMNVIRQYLPLELRQTRITVEEMWEILSYSALHQQTIESACDLLPQAPSGNRVREVLLATLPSWSELQRKINRVLKQQLHPSLFKRSRPFRIAIDLTLIPYHGQPEEDEAEVYRSEAKAGTTHFHAYATLAIVHDKRRYTVAILYVQKEDSMASLVRRLLDRVKRLKIKVRRVYLDAGFSSVAVFKVLDRCHLAYVVPLPPRGRSGGIRNLFTVSKSHSQDYTIKSPTAGTYTIRAVAVKRYLKGRYGRHGVKWFAFAVSGEPLPKVLSQIFEWYRQRFGIETSYRQMHRVRARTTSRNPALRLLLVGLAFIFVNLFVTLRQRVNHNHENVIQVRKSLTLNQMAISILHVIEHIFGLTSVATQGDSHFVFS